MAPEVPGRWRALRIARRLSQATFLLLFLFLIGATVQFTGGAFDAETSARVPYPVEAFLNIDPLAAALVLLAARVLPGAMIFSLVVIIAAAFLGRAFCGWVCPLGTMNHLASELAPSLRGEARLAANRTRPYQKIKYLVLAAVLGSALLGSALGGLVDPLSLATRGIALTVLPWLEWLWSGALGAASQSDHASLARAADGAFEAAHGWIPTQGGTIAASGLAISLVFVAVLAANRFIPRFWCRGLCPLGALLGLAGRFGALGLDKNATACTRCGACALHCSGAASPRPEDPWQRAECDLCMNCVAACPHESIAFRLAGRPSSEVVAPDLGRRRVLASAVAGAALVPALRTGSLVSPEGRPDPRCIRPPGARAERELLARCIRCGQCMKICPNNALQPAVGEAGLEGLWSPVLVPRIGYCEPTCTLCTQVCPTGAIRRVTEAEKTGRDGAAMVRLGTAFIDQGRCLPHAMRTPCIVCEEFCPVSPKAIVFDAETVEIDGAQVVLKRPRVVPAQCNGCGACEHVCPVRDRAAIRVTAIGESRAPEHELLLHRDAPKIRKKER